MKNLRLPYWARVSFLIYGLKLEKYLNYLSGLEFILRYTGARLEKYWDYLTEFGLIL